MRDGILTHTSSASYSASESGVSLVPPINGPRSLTPHRRICPGRALAEETLLLAIVSILAHFDIARTRDPEGHLVEPCQEMTNTFMPYV